MMSLMRVTPTRLSKIVPDISRVNARCSPVAKFLCGMPYETVYLCSIENECRLAEQEAARLRVGGGAGERDRREQEEALTSHPGPLPSMINVPWTGWALARGVARR